MNDQQQFWAETYATEYIRKNSQFDVALGVDGWSRMLARAEDVGSVLECGCNIGRNIGFLDHLLPQAKKSIVEISKPAYDFVTSHYQLNSSFHGAILNSTFAAQSFDLVFTMGVLIHIHPDDLLANMKKMFDYSARYVLMGEYFNRTPIMLEYQGEKDKLFKCDFGKLFIENFDVKLVDYGFLWEHVYDKAGFGDITWWLFEKN